MTLTWSHLLPVLLLTAAVAPEAAASKDIEREADLGRYGIFWKQLRSVSKDDEDALPFGSTTQAQPTAVTVPTPSTSPTTASTGISPSTTTVPTCTPANSSSQASSPLSPLVDSNGYKYDYEDEDDDSEYELDRDVDNRYDDDGDDDDDDNNYLRSLNIGRSALPMRQSDSDNIMSVSFNKLNEGNIFARAARNGQSNYVRSQRRLRMQQRRAAARRRRRQQRRNRRRREQRRRLHARRRRNNRRRRPVHRQRRGSPRRSTRRGQNRVINMIYRLEENNIDL